MLNILKLKLIEDIKSIILRTEILLVDQRIIELEMRQLGTEILENMLGYTIED